MLGFISIVSALNLLFLSLYVSGTGSFPKPLTPKQERECLAKIKAGDPKAKNLLIEHNLRLVVHIIKKYYSSISDQEDLISIGTIGLIKAVSTFDYDKGARFATYASRCIENEILMYFRSKRKSSQDLYLSDPIDSDNDGNSITLGDIMSDDISIYDCLEQTIRAEHLREAIAKILDSREQEIIILRYGINGAIPLTQREVSDKLNISRSYVSRIEKKALEKLKGEFGSAQ